jgi:hypothetical protein
MSWRNREYPRKARQRGFFSLPGGFGAHRPASAGGSGALDTFLTGMTGAYHLNKLRGAYTGPCMRVVRMDGAGVDPWYYSNVLHVKADQSAADASTTFVDHSYLAHTAAAGGNAQVDTGTVRFASRSMQFDGNGDFINCGTHAAFDLYHCDFSVRIRCRFTSLANTPTLLSCYLNSTTGYLIGVTTTGSLFMNLTGDANDIATATGAIVTGTWYDIEICRTGTTMYVFINGALNTTATTASTAQSSVNSSNLWIGGMNATFPARALNGHIEELQLTVGYGRHTAAYTAPAAVFPFAAPSGHTELDIDFVDGMYDIVTLAAFAAASGPGQVMVKRMYDQSAVGRDLLQASYEAMPVIVREGVVLDHLRFDGNNDYFATTAASGTPTGVTVFAHCNVRSFRGISGYEMLAELSTDANNVSGWYVNFNNATYVGLGWAITDTGGANNMAGLESDATSPLVMGVATGLFDRSALATAKRRAFWNGAELAPNDTSATGTVDDATFSADTIYVGARTSVLTSFSRLNFKGAVFYETAKSAADIDAISDLLRALEDLVYSGSVLTSDPHYASVTALLRFNQANGATALVDQIGNTWTANGNAQVSTSDVKYGTGCGVLDGNGDYFSATIPSLIGTGDFTVEAWIKIASLASDGEILCISDALGTLNNFNLVFEYKTTGALRGSIQFGSSGTVNVDISSAASALTTGVWHHVAFTALATNAKLWINGVQAATGTITGTRAQSQTTVRIGHLSTASGGTVNRYFNGRIDDVRVTKACRYTAAFTPPTEAPSPFALKYDSAWTIASSTNDAQGVADDGTNLYVTNSTTLRKYAKTGGAALWSVSVTGDDPVTKDQINGVFYKDGKVFVSAARYAGAPTSWIVEYDADDGAYIATHSIGTTGFSEAPCYAHGFWWVVYHATMTVSRFSDAWVKLADYPLTFSVTGSSGGFGSGQGYDGLAFRGGYLLMPIHTIYDQDYWDVYYWNLVTDTMDKVARILRPTTKAHQGIALDRSDDGVIWAAERATSGDDGVAKILVTTTD